MQTEKVDVSAEAIEALRIELEKAKAEKSGRQSATIALNGLHEFIVSLPPFFERSLEASLFRIMLALNDLDIGVVAPMLRPQPCYNSRHPECAARKIMKAYCSFTLDCLLSAGLSLEEACRHVAKALRGSDFLKSGRTGADWKTVRGWRDGVSN